MKRFRIIHVFAITALLSTTAFQAPFEATNAAAQHGLSVKEYEEFHHVLHPLEHEALPKKDFRRIRAKANQLVKRGNAIGKLGVPGGVSQDKTEEFAKELNRFREALAKFKANARRGTNAQLKASYSAVHDSFETLAGMLPR